MDADSKVPVDRNTKHNDKPKDNVKEASSAKMKKYKNTRNHPVNFAVGGVNYSAPPGGTIQVPESETGDKYFQAAQLDLREIN